MKCNSLLQLLEHDSRSSHEERGLKFRLYIGRENTFESRSSHEERGLKSVTRGFVRSSARRSSHEERGLKSLQMFI